VNSTAVIWQRSVVPVKKINKEYKVMLQNIKQLYGDKLAALDGDIGHVKDFYFDDESWVIRYLVADTGSWLTGRLVLLTPHAFGKLDQSEKTFHIKLHKKQIEDSPSIESHKPVSRQFEVEYYGYYGWPPYWDGGGMSGIGPIPVALPLLVDRIKPHQKHKHREDKHLRSTQAISGYHIQTSDGEIGQITDFIIDEKGWTIRDLVIETGHWYSGKEILIPSSKVKQISYEETKVFVSLTKEDIQRTAEKEISVHSR
jgi:sporulation protein YlmC with PRC-barrel domain